MDRLSRDRAGAALVNEEAENWFFVINCDLIVVYVLFCISMCSFQEAIYESLSRMSYLDHCFNEALRLYPPALRTDRCANRDVKLGPYFLPKGTVVAIPIREVMRDPQLWENPDEFNPDR